MTHVADRTAFQRDTLFVISGLDEPNGVEIRRELEQSQCRSILPGRIYTNLDELVEDGLVRKHDLNGRSNTYRLTAEGERVLAELLEWQERYYPSTNVA
jgi:DNA-binding PadR family transcriptional regulator